MNFSDILHIAKKNERHKKEPIKCLQTKFKPPTKEQRDKDRVLSDGVQKFLARKEEEERLKKKEERRKKEELLAMRALDPKANRRIQHMLKRTKSANKSVMDDVDTTNTADTIGGPAQPDEDDYGFVSAEATAQYEKLMKKVYSIPSDEVKFAPSKKPTGGNLSNTKERVKMALLKQEEEEHGPRKRKRRKKDGGGAEDDDDDISCKRPTDTYKNEQDKYEKPKAKKPAGPPPMDFMELLKLAEKKQHEPVVIEPKVKKEPEPDQLMTKKQRLEHEKQLEFQRQRDLRLKERERISNGKPAPIKRIPKIGQTSSEQRMEPQKANETKNKPESSHGVSKSTKSSTIVDRPKPSSDLKIPKIGEKAKVSKPAGSEDRVSKKPVESEAEKLKRERDEVLRLLKEKEEAVRILEEKEKLIRERNEALAKLKKLEEMEGKSKTVASKSKPVPSLSKPTQARGSSSDASKSTVPGRAFPPKDVRPTVRQFPPNDVKKAQPAVREFPPRDVRGVSKNGERPLTKEQKIQLLKKRLAEQKRRRIQDSDEDEYDSELDDFIDDGPDPTMRNEDVSKAISEIFKYDKNKYSRYDDGIECMESNYAQISKEEFYSAKCGLLEDLEDIRAEKMELARKKAKSKKK